MQVKIKDWNKRSESIWEEKASQFEFTFVSHRSHGSFVLDEGRLLISSMTQIHIIFMSYWVGTNVFTMSFMSMFVLFFLFYSTTKVFLWKLYKESPRACLSLKVLLQYHSTTNGVFTHVHVISSKDMLHLWDCKETTD